VLWSKFRRLGFCNSSDLELVLRTFLTTSRMFLFLLSRYRLLWSILVSMNVFLIVSLLKPWGRTVFQLNLLNYCFHLFVVMCCMFSIMQSLFLFFLLCERRLLFGRLLRLVHLLVLLTSAQLVLFLFYLRRLNAFSMSRCWNMSIVAICC
jgi:hypothetical protein